MFIKEQKGEEEFNIYIILRGRAGVARWAHNPKVEGSNPSPATK